MAELPNITSSHSRLSFGRGHQSRSPSLGRRTAVRSGSRICRSTLANEHGAATELTFDGLLGQLRAAHLFELETAQKQHDADAKHQRMEAEKLRITLQRWEQKGTRPSVHMSQRNSLFSTESMCDASRHASDYPPAFEDNNNQAEQAVLDDLQNIEICMEGLEFKVHPDWEKLVADAGLNFADQQSCHAENSHRVMRSQNGSDAATHGCVIMPSSGFRLAWDICGLILICYDLLMIPFNQSFQPQETITTQTIDWITLLFWTGDMLQGFFLGYFADGQVITDNRMVLCNYLRTWFLVDVVVVVPEWIMVFLNNLAAGELGDIGKLSKIARVARVLRLLRLLKMKKLMETVMDNIESEYAFIMFNLAHLLCFVMVLNHVIACLWYLVARLTQAEGHDNWVDHYKIQENNDDISFLYATSLHWSLTQFTPASMDISARNIWERWFSLIVLMFAMLFFSSVVGSITAAMTAMRSLQGSDVRQFWLLRRYLSQRNIHKGLARRIIKFLEHRSTIQGNLVQRDKVPLLDVLSEVLQDELMTEMHWPTLRVHPFFSGLKAAMPAVMQRLCSNALELLLHAVDDTTFNAGDEAKKMFFVKSGELAYATLQDDEVACLKNKDWLTEAVLFTAWRHKGSLQACTESELIAVDPDQFMAVLSVHPRPWHCAATYAKEFVQYMNALHAQGLPDSLNDLCRHEGMYEHLMTVCDFENFATASDVGTAGSRLEGLKAASSPPRTFPRPSWSSTTPMDLPTKRVSERSQEGPSACSSRSWLCSPRVRLLPRFLQ